MGGRGGLGDREQRRASYSTCAVNNKVGFFNCSVRYVASHLCHGVHEALRIRFTHIVYAYNIFECEVVAGCFGVHVFKREGIFRGEITVIKYIYSSCNRRYNTCYIVTAAVKVVFPSELWVPSSQR